MTLDPVTFLLEILNFLVLLWLLQRFLYKPVRAAIARRQQTLELSLEQAQARERQAVQLEREYRQRLEQWEAEKEQHWSVLQQSLVEEREKAMAKVRAAAEAEKLRQQTLLQQDNATLQRQARERAVRAALQLTRRMLERLAGEALDQALLNMMQEDLTWLPEAEREALRLALHRQPGRITVTSARPLAEAQLAALQQALARLLEQEVSYSTAVEPDLISGIRVSIGARVLQANLKDELAFFQTGLNHAAS